MFINITHNFIWKVFQYEKMSDILWTETNFPKFLFLLKAEILSLAKDAASPEFTFLVVEKTSANPQVRTILCHLFFQVKMRVRENEGSWKVKLVQLETQNDQSHKCFTSRQPSYFILPILPHRMLQRQVLKGWYVIKLIHFNSLSKIFLAAFVFHCECVVRSTLYAHRVSCTVDVAVTLTWGQVPETLAVFLHCQGKCQHSEYGA